VNISHAVKKKTPQKGGEKETPPVSSKKKTKDQPLKMFLFGQKTGIYISIFVLVFLAPTLFSPGPPPAASVDLESSAKKLVAWLWEIQRREEAPFVPLSWRDCTDGR